MIFRCVVTAFLLLLIACDSSAPIEEKTEETLTGVEYAPVGEPYCVDSTSPEQDRFSSLLTLVQDVRNGKGDIKTEVIEENSVECGYAESCPSDFSFTDDPNFDYVNCDGILQRTDVNFPYSEDSTYVNTIEILFLVDSRLDTEGLTQEAFVEREIEFANSVFENSGVFIKLSIADIRTIELSQTRSLRSNIRYLGDRRYEYRDVNAWMIEANADLTYVFLNPRQNPEFCGAAYIDASTDISKRVGIVQCYQNTVFQPDYLRYYNRAHETFVHEVGHNLGLEHDIDNTSNLNGIFPFSLGYVIPNTTETYSDGSVFNGYGTIMSYSDEATKMFSNPDLTFTLPDGRIVANGDNGNSFSLFPPPETNAVYSLNRVRTYMSNLDLNTSETFFQLSEVSEDAICIF